MSIPEALAVKPIASVDTMEIDTNILNPVVRTETFMRFVLMKKGILDPGSCIALSLNCGSADGVMPIATGIHALIKQAVLRIGSKVVAVTDKYPEYATMRRQHQTQEEKTRKDMVRSGTMDVICPERDETGAGIGGEYSLRNVVKTGTTVLEAPEQFKLTTTGSTNNQYYIKLSQLFPAMRNVSLPLYLINEPCSIEITFNKQASGQNGTIVTFSSDVAAGSDIASVNTADTVFLADYLTYTDDRMQRLAGMVMSQDGLVIPYLDVITTNTSFSAVPQPAATASTERQEIHDLGLSGMKVQSILAHYHDKAGSEDTANPLGVYGSKAYTRPVRYNIRVNDKQLYPIDIESETQKAHQLSQVFGTDINIGSGQYSFNPIIVNKTTDVRNYPAGANHYFNNAGLLNVLGAGHLLLRKLEGNSHYMGADFTIDGGVGQGVVCGQTPIRVINNVVHQNTDFSGRDVTYFSIVERQMQIKAGNVTVSA
ncbi:MAG: hypothetical protein MPK62_07535 [Alphaproteobacteria bacterium]|nr:hypothetical protein [Alphaproteobacteria bacterium]